MSDDAREKELKNLTEKSKGKYTKDLTDDDKEDELKDVSDDDVSEKDAKNLTDEDKEKLLKVLDEDEKEKDTINDDQENSENSSHHDRENDPKDETDNGKEKDPESKTDEERESDLKILFDLSCETSTGKGGTIPLDGVQSWFRKAGITRAYHIKESDIGSAFRKSVMEETGISYPEFKEMIATLATEKKLDPNEILEKLSSARTPQPGEIIDYEKEIGRKNVNKFFS